MTITKKKVKLKHSEINIYLIHILLVLLAVLLHLLVRHDLFTDAKDKNSNESGPPRPPPPSDSSSEEDTSESSDSDSDERSNVISTKSPPIRSNITQFQFTMSWTFKDTNRTDQCDLLSVMNAPSLDLTSICFKETIKFDFKQRVLYSQPDYSPFSFTPIDAYSIVNAAFEARNSKGNFLFSWNKLNKNLELVKSGCIEQSCLDYVKSLKSSCIIQLFNESDIRIFDMSDKTHYALNQTHNLIITNETMPDNSSTLVINDGLREFHIPYSSLSVRARNQTYHEYDSLSALIAGQLLTAHLENETEQSLIEIMNNLNSFYIEINPKIISVATDQASNQMTFELTFSDQQTPVVSKTVKLAIPPNSVSGVQLVGSSQNSLNVAWFLPDGMVDYFIIDCIDLSIPASALNRSKLTYTVSNTTQKASCYDLNDLNPYEIKITSVKEIDGDKYTSSTTGGVYWTTSKYGNSCTDPDCIKLYGMSKTNFTNATDESILAIVEQVDTTFDSAVVSYSSNESDLAIDDNKLVSIIQSSADILYGISLRETETESDSIILYYLKLMNEILNISLDVFKTSHQQSNSSNKLSHGIETIINKFDMRTSRSAMFNAYLYNLQVQIIDIGGGGKFDYLRNGFVTYNPSASDIERKKYLSSESNLNSSLVNEFLSNYPGLSLAAFYNQDFLKQLVDSGQSLRLTYLGFMNSKLFTGQSASNLLDCNENRQISPSVLKVKSVSELVSNDSIPNKYPDLVYTIFDPQIFDRKCGTNKRHENKKISFECVFWDYTSNDWSGVGCNHSISIDPINQVPYHVCVCNHTTNFALLMVVDGEAFCDWCDQVLFYISIIGISISIIGLLATIIYDIALSILPSTDRKRTVNTNGLLEAYASMSRQYLKLVTVWCVTILLMNCFYIAFSLFSFSGTPSQLSSGTKASCIIIGVFMHYFLLSSFCFSACISVVQYIILCRSFKIYKFILLKSMIVSFSVPLIPIVIILAIDNEAYIDSNHYCWLSGLYSIMTVLLPIGFILTLNVFFFLMTAISHSSLVKSRDKYLRTLESKSKGVKREVMFIVTCFINTGLTWLFGFLVTIPTGGTSIYTRFVFALLFCLLNSTQGLHIFIIYILISKRRHQLLKEKLKYQFNKLREKWRQRFGKARRRTNSDGGANTSRDDNTIDDIGSIEPATSSETISSSIDTTTNELSPGGFNSTKRRNSHSRVSLEVEDFNKSQ